MSATVTIAGIQAAQAANLRLMVAARPAGGLGRAVHLAATMLHRYAVIVTHVDTGALRASHRVEARGLARYEIFIDPTSPGITRGRRGAAGARERPAVYGLKEHGRGGAHAFYERTFFEHGPTAGTRALAYLEQEMS